MSDEWVVVLEFMILAVLLILGTVIKRKVAVFRKLIIPISMIAGFLGLIAGSEVLGIISLDPQRLGRYVYHLMAVGFIALTLKDRPINRDRVVTRTGAFIVSTYVIQGIIGFGISIVFLYTLMPGIFPAFGLLLPLGFGQGPGQAFSIGTQWEAMGFQDGGNIGLSVATFGFVWACIGGVLFMNIMLRKGKYKRKIAENKSITKIHEEDDSGDIPLSESIDRISIQLSMIGVVYLGTFLLLNGLDLVLNNFGTFGQTLAQMFWGFHFLVGSLLALVFNAILKFLKKRKIVNRRYPNNYLLSRISSGAFDFMITASISAISITVLRRYLAPTLLMTTLGGLATAFWAYFVAKKVMKRDILEYTLGFFGTYTGTLSTGMALLREVDPNFNTHVAEHIVLGSGVALFLGVPLMLVLSIPTVGYVSNKPIMYLYTFLALIAYLAVLLGILFWARKRSPVDAVLETEKA